MQIACTRVCIYFLSHVLKTLVNNPVEHRFKQTKLRQLNAFERFVTPFESKNRDKVMHRLPGKKSPASISVIAEESSADQPAKRANNVTLITILFD